MANRFRLAINSHKKLVETAARTTDGVLSVMLGSRRWQRGAAGWRKSLGWQPAAAVLARREDDAVAS